MALELNQNNVDATLKEKKVTVLDFWAPWCGPCRMLGPIIEELGSDNANKDVTVAKINVEENQELAVKYGIRGIPTVVIFNDGKEYNRKTGVLSKLEYQSIIDSLL